LVVGLFLFLKGGDKGASGNDDALFITPGGGDVTFKSGQEPGAAHPVKKHAGN
jgi:hypothetical protein